MSFFCEPASVAELADALDSKSSEGNFMGVRLSPEAPLLTVLLFFCRICSFPPGEFLPAVLIVFNKMDSLRDE